MKTTRILLLTAVSLWGEADCFSQSVFWNGNGDGTSWSNPQNWVGQQVPGPTNNVVITNGAGANVVISSAVAVESILCSKALTISSGSLAVTSGSSSLQGALSVTSGATLSASGNNTTLTSSGSVAIDDANLYVSGGATISLPGAVNCNNSVENGETIWQANGAGSMLVLAGLTNLAEPSDYCPEFLLIQAMEGGQVNLSGLISISGVVEMQSDASGSEINLSALQDFGGYSSCYPAQLQATDGGTILTGPLEGLTGVSVLLGGGTLNLSTVMDLSYSTVTVTNGEVILGDVMNIENANFYVSGGATLSLPGVLNCIHNVENAVTVWQTSGAGSMLALAGLTNLAKPTGYCVEYQVVQAMAGGQVNLGGLVSISGVVEMQSSGSGSEINLSDLQDFGGYSSCYPAQLQASAGGTILAGQLEALTGVSVVLGAGGTLNLSTVTNLSYTTLTVTNGEVTLSNVVNIDDANFYVSGGATLSLPGVLNCINNVENAVTVWQATGPGSMLALAGLTNLAEPTGYCTEYQVVQAMAGGQVNLSGLISISGVEEMQSSGSGSEINLSSLQDFGGYSSCYPAQLQASDAGTILTGQLEALTGVSVVLGAGGTLNLSTVMDLSYSTLTVTNGDITLSDVINIDDANLYVSGGAALSLPGVVNCINSVEDGVTVWQVSGVGSVLALAGLTNLAEATGYCTEYQLVQAMAGGQVNLSGLVSISGVVEMQSSGSGSEINLSALQNFGGYSSCYPAQLQASGGGTILAGRLEGLTGVSVVLGAGGTLNLNSVTDLSYTTLTLTNGEMTLSNVVNIDNANLYVSGGATLSLPGVVNCINSVEDGEIVWQASGTGSTLALTGLTNLAEPSDYCTEYQLVQAMAGGQVNLAGLISISGVVEIQSSDNGSEINLSSLQDFGGYSSCYPAQLQASGAGTILTGQLEALTGVSVLLGAGGTLNLSTVSDLSYTTLTLTNGAVTLSNVVSINDANLYVSGGATLSLPGVVNCNDSPFSSGTVWQASGTNSELSLAGLTNLSVPNANCPEVQLIQAVGGGLVNLGGLISISGVVNVQSTGGGSEVNLSALQVFAGSSDCNSPQLQASQGGAILAGQLENVTDVAVVLGGGTLNLNSLTNLSYSTLTVTNGVSRLSSIVNIDDASLYVSGGATLSLPSVQNCNDSGDSAVTVWQASGTNSVLALSGLTNLAVPNYNCVEAQSIQALGGGQVNLGGLVTISGVVEVLSSGGGSEVNLSALQVFGGYSSCYPAELQANQGGTVLTGQLEGLTGVSVFLGGGGLDLSTVTDLSYSTVTITNGEITLSNVVNIDDASLYVSGGATFSLPSVQNCNDGVDSFVSFWQASGANSVLALSGLTNLAVPNANCSEALSIQALASGQINLSGLNSISGVVEILSSGSGSQLDLSALQVFGGYSSCHPAQFQVSDNGAILTGQLESLTGVSVGLGGGRVNLSTVTNLSYSSVTVTNGALTLANVSEITNASFYVTNGATLSLPAVMSCNDSSGANVVWQAGGTGSVLSLAGVTNLTGPAFYNCSVLIEALAGGDVELSQLSTISNVEVQVESSGSGSVVDLTRLVNYQTATTTLNADNGGVIVLAQPKLTITANNASMTYGGTVPMLSVSYNGFTNGQTSSSLTTQPTITTIGTSLSHAGTYPIIASGAVDTNYTIVYVPGTLTINPALLTITPSNESKTYGQTAPLPATAFSAVGLLNGDTIAGVTLTSPGAAPTASIGSYTIMATNASGPRAGNYSITYGTGTLTVNPTTLIITANNASKYFGQTFNFAGTAFTSRGLQNGETVGSVTLISSGASASATVAGSPYPIIPSAATGGTFAPTNYTIYYTNGLLTVLPVGTPPGISSVLPDAGPTNGGTVVTIEGANFENGAGVMFGTLPAASVTVESSSNLTAVTPASPSGTVSVMVNNPDGNSATNLNAFIFGVGPAITLQPTNLTLPPTQTAQFQVQATGAPTLAYQWQFNAANLLEDSHTTGTQTPTLTVNRVQPNDDGYYRCVVTNLYASVTSTAAVLSVTAPPSSVVVTPPSASVGFGGSVSLTASANGTPPFGYYWYQNGSLLSGQTASVLNIANAQSNASYAVVVSNASGLATSAPVALTLLGYCINGQPTQTTYPEGTNFIPINVVTYGCGSNTPVPNSAAVVWLSIDGTSRNLTVFTDGSGNGVAYFTPLPVEVGLVKYGFALPGQAQPAPVGSFTIIGMNLSAQSESPQLVVGIPQTNTLLLNNLTAVPLTGITATVLGAPGNVNVQVSVPSVLTSNGAVQTTYILEATSLAQTEVTFSIQYTSAQGATVTLPFTASISPPTARLSTIPPSLVGTMIEGSQTLVPFTITNFGAAPSGPIQVNLPVAGWLSCATGQPIPSLAPGQSGQITLALMPTNGQALGEYTGDLVVQGSNTSLTVPFVFTAVSALKGNLQVTVQDELTYYAAGAPNLSNATVTVNDFLTGTNVGVQVTGASGIVTFSNLTSAYYTVMVEAPDHGNFNTTLLLAAGTTTPLTAFLSENLVNYTWTVTPTTVADEYFFTLTTIFVTEVPWPEVAVTPVDLCSLQNCTNQVDLVVTNAGLIAAEGLQLVIQNSNPDWTFTALVTNLGNLAAESSIVVPVTFTRVGCGTNSCDPGAIAASLNWYVAALNGTEYNSTPIFIYNSCCTNSSTPVGYVVGSPGGGGGGTVVTQPVNYTTPPTPGAVVNVTLQIDQTAIITANAFHATLSLTNGADAPITDLQVTINPLDSNGVPSPNSFFIQPPLLSGLNAVDGNGSLAVGAGGQANWTIIPTTNAAPEFTTTYGIGGSISYVLNGELVTIPLFAVPITVLPEPQLYLDYFLQHDVYSQDPFTSVIEPPIPFALGLRVRNLGYGVADDFTITSAQPVIINNANGLLINFQIIASDVGANSTPVPSLTLNMGNINPGTNVEGIWYMTSSLEGSFTNFEATFQHLDALGGMETSLIQSVKIHELNHVVEITCPNNDGLPDFLCNDTTNVDALPDDVYSSDGNVYPVTSLTGAVATGVVSGINSSVSVNDAQDIIPTGFVYFQLADPSQGQYAITSVKRSDGTELLVGTNVWQTPYRPHMVPPQLTNLIHIFDCNSTGSYTLTYGSAVAAPQATTLAALNVTPTNATLVGIINPESGSTEYYFEWGMTTNYGNFTQTNWLTANLGSPQEVTAYINNLLPTTATHYKVVAINSAGTTYGSDLTVTTPALPIPMITQESNQTVIVGQRILFTNFAVVATPPVTYTLGGVVPAGASITTNGVFNWTPTCEQGSTTNEITIWATDSGTPPLSNYMTFVVTVSECVQLGIGSAVLQAGQSNAVQVSLFSTVGITNLTFSLAVPANRFTNYTITADNSNIATATVQTVGSALPFFTLVTKPGQPLPSPSVLGTIGFTALPGDSAFVPVAATNIIGIQSGGSLVGNINSLPGQITVVGFHPLLSSALAGNSMITLTLYGTPGSNYVMAYSTNLASTNWQTEGSVLLSNVQQSISIPATNALMYFRLQ